MEVHFQILTDASVKWKPSWTCSYFCRELWNYFYHYSVDIRVSKTIETLFWVYLSQTEHTLGSKMSTDRKKNASHRKLLRVSKAPQSKVSTVKWQGIGLLVSDQDFLPYNPLRAPLQNVTVALLVRESLESLMGQIVANSRIPGSHGLPWKQK